MNDDAFPLNLLVEALEVLHQRNVPRATKRFYARPWLWRRARLEFEDWAEPFTDAEIAAALQGDGFLGTRWLPWAKQQCECYVEGARGCHA